MSGAPPPSYRATSEHVVTPFGDHYIPRVTNPRAAEAQTNALALVFASFLFQSDLNQSIFEAEGQAGLCCYLHNTPEAAADIEAATAARAKTKHGS